VIEVRQVQDRREKHRFLSFPWQIYRGDPLWVPPIFSEREKATDPLRGLFFRNGYADFFVAYKDGILAGTLCCSSTGGPETASWDLECCDDPRQGPSSMPPRLGKDGRGASQHLQPRSGGCGV
jgi:hypothetical protein